MIKTISVLISALAVLIVSFFSSPEPGVTITSKVAPKLVPGEDCVVSLTISPTGLTGYARLQQVLPLGLTASPVSTMGAYFELKENVISFTWDDIPEDEAFVVSYKVQTDPNKTTVETISGSLYYTTSNEALVMAIEPVRLDFSPALSNDAAARVERKITSMTPVGGEYKVELTIHKKEGEQRARYIDNIPEGYTVTTINANGATFMFSNHQATFQWASLPAEPVFKISYHLNSTAARQGDPVVSGMLVYDGDEASAVNVASASVPAPSPVSTPSDVIASSLIEQEANKQPLRQATADAGTPPGVAYIPAPQKGIFFKIQIAATRKSPVRSDDFFQKKYHLGQHVDLTEHDGWRKYMIGNFDSFESANEFSLRMRAKIPDAFVVAYRNSERIAVREAVSETSKSD